MSNRIYIAGKITGLTEPRYKYLFETAEQGFLLLKYEVINPVKLPDDHDKSWKAYMRVCLPALRTCNYIFMLNNWADSRGARLEEWYAKRYGIKPIYQPKIN